MMAKISFKTTKGFNLTDKLLREKERERLANKIMNFHQSQNVGDHLDETPKEW